MTTEEILVAPSKTEEYVTEVSDKMCQSEYSSEYEALAGEKVAVICYDTEAEAKKGQPGSNWNLTSNGEFESNKSQCKKQCWVKTGNNKAVKVDTEITKKNTGNWAKVSDKMCQSVHGNTFEKIPNTTVPVTCYDTQAEAKKTSSAELKVQHATTSAPHCKKQKCWITVNSTPLEIKNQEAGDTIPKLTVTDDMCAAADPAKPTAKANKTIDNATCLTKDEAEKDQANKTNLTQDDCEK